MKKLIISSFIFMIITGASFAQSKTSFTGPKAKNYKPWENKSTFSNPISHLEEPDNRVFGGKAKNQRPVLHTEKVIVIQSDSKKTQLMSPKAKNYKVWKD